MTGLRGKPRRGQSEEISRQAAASERSDIHTMLPAEIVDFDAATQTATVRVLHVPRLLGKEQPFPDLPAVPVVFPRGAGGVLTFPIEAGAPGSLMIAERDFSAWYEDGKAHTADTNRMHDLSDAVFVPGGMVAAPGAIPSFNTERAEFRTLDGHTTIQISKDRIRACRGKFRFIANSEEKFVQLKISPSDDPNEGGIAPLHITLDEENERIVMSHAPVIEEDPNPED